MRRLLPLVLLYVFVAGCGTLPRDAAGTTERIERQGVMRVAVMPATPDAQAALNLLDNFASRHGAKIDIVPVYGEHALRWLDDGKVDAVVGHFSKASPWKADVSLSQSVGRSEPTDSSLPILRIARRNGENALILAVDRAIIAGMK